MRVVNGMKNFSILIGSSNMDKYKIHFFFFGTLLLYISIGWAFYPSAKFIMVSTGWLIASLTDPLIIIGGILIGIGVQKQKIIISISVLYSIILSIFIYYKSREFGATIGLGVIIIRFVAILVIVYFVNAIYVWQNKDKELEEKDQVELADHTDLNKSALEKISILDKVKNHFEREMLFRVFIIIQILAIILFTYYEMTNHYSWDLFDDFFRKRYWTSRSDNWMFLLVFLAPYLSVKAIQWIQDSKKE